MFGIGFQEILIILLVALIVVGPKKLPKVARSIGRALKEFQKSIEEVKEALEAEELQETLEEERRKLERAMHEAKGPTPQKSKESNEHTREGK